MNTATLHNSDVLLPFFGVFIYSAQSWNCNCFKFLPCHPDKLYSVVTTFPQLFSSSSHHLSHSLSVSSNTSLSFSTIFPSHLMSFSHCQLSSYNKGFLLVSFSSIFLTSNRCRVVINHYPSPPINNVLTYTFCLLLWLWLNIFYYIIFFFDKAVFLMTKAEL